jgi:HEAT repeat protein
VAALATLLADTSPDVGYWAATLLGRLGPSSAEAVPALTGALANEIPISVRQRAAWALGQIGPSAAVSLDAMRRATSDPDRRLARLAQKAISQIEGQE